MTFEELAAKLMTDPIVKQGMAIADQQPQWPDPHWEWRRVEALGMPERWIAIRCNHLETEPVITIDGEHVARLCLTCDTQLPPA